MDDSGYINIGECAGQFQIISKDAYDKDYNDLKKIHEQGGDVAVLECLNQPPVSTNPHKSAMRWTLIQTIVKELSSGKIHLNTADEINKVFKH